jgi:hypothetical protein
MPVLIPTTSSEQYPAVSNQVDSRKAYEAPRVLLKRSVAHATLATQPAATGPSTSQLTGPG